MTSGARFQEAHHVELRRISLMRHLLPVPRVKMHPLTARNMGIGDGEWVWIESRRVNADRQYDTILAITQR